MARIFIEGFEGQDRALWQSVSDPSNWSILNNDPDFTGYHLVKTNEYSAGWYHAILPGEYTELYGAFKCKRTYNSVTDTRFLQFWQANVPVFNIGCTESPYKWYINTYRWGGSIPFVADEICDLNILYKVQFYAKIHDTLGRFILKVDDIIVLNWSGDTIYNAYYDRITSFTVGPSQLGKFKIDDIILDTAEFPGDTTILGLRAIGAGTSTEWTPSGGDNYDNVNDEPYNDATFNWTNDVDQVDSFETDNLSGAILEVKAVQLSARVVKEGLATPQNLSFIANIGGTEYESQDYAIPTLKGPLYHCFDVSPATSADWMEDEVNSAEFGYKSKT